jgi:hypothetical protein
LAREFDIEEVLLLWDAIFSSSRLYKHDLSFVENLAVAMIVSQRDARKHRLWIRSG